jgi:hypothetical protein
MPERLVLSYHGGTAERHALDLYDASRALYGAARFLYTLDNFRLTGHVVERVTSTHVRFELLPSSAGSFEFNFEYVKQISELAAPAVAEALAKVPLEAIIGWVTEKIRGGRKHAPVDAVPGVPATSETAQAVQA